MMKYKKIIVLLLLIIYSTSNFAQKHSKFHKVTVQEILQVSSYTYLFVKEDNKTKWLAAPQFDAKVGAVYYYKGGVEMVNFKSKELNRTFNSVYFVSAVYDNPFEEKKPGFQHSKNIDMATSTSKDVKSINSKLDINIEPEEGVISIAELFRNKKKYEGKRIKFKGQVTKFNSKVMSKNWIHLQDGTEFNKKFDLTFTSKDEVKVGDIVVLEGLVSLDKDFGYGYFYDFIIENSIKIK